MINIFMVGHFLESMEGNIKCSKINVKGEDVRTDNIQSSGVYSENKEHLHMLFSPNWLSSLFHGSYLLQF